MARKKQQDECNEAPGWIMTFADLMSLLAAFFVLIISFSVQDDKKLQVVAGSMQNAFGVEHFNTLAGLIQIEGTPIRKYAKDVSLKHKEKDINISKNSNDKKKMQGPEKNTYDVEKADIEKSRNFSLAAETIKQSWQKNPQITEVSKSVIMEETTDGMNIQIIDKSGKPMFAKGSKKPYPHTVELIKAMAPAIKNMHNLIKITGHTSSLITNEDKRKGWQLTMQRAEEIRKILIASGIPYERIHSVIGMADREPLYPEDPQLSINRRVTITLISEEPPIPVEAKLNR